MELQEQLTRFHKNAYPVIKIQVAKQSFSYPISPELIIIIIQSLKKIPQSVWVHIFQLSARKELQNYILKNPTKPLQWYQNFLSFLFIQTHRKFVENLKGYFLLWSTVFMWLLIMGCLLFSVCCAVYSYHTEWGGEYGNVKQFKPKLQHTITDPETNRGQGQEPILLNISSIF